jgi:membrane fusion protein, multidrug efflux system
MQFKPLRSSATWICLGFVALSVSCSKHTTTHAPAAAAPVTAVRVTTRDVPQEVRAIGNVQAYSSVMIRAQVTGQLMKTHFEEGQQVKKGDLLFTIDPRQYQAALSQAQAELAQSEAKLQQAQRDWQRAQKLGPSEALAQSAYDAYKANYHAAQAAILASRAAVSNAALNVEFTTIRSPIDGRTGNVLIKEGNIIKAEDDQILVINQVRPIYVDFAVPEQHLSMIRQRMQQGTLEVTAEVPGAGGTAPSPPGNEGGRGSTRAAVDGQLTVVNNTVDPNTGTVLLRAVFPNQDEALWPGQFVNVVLTLDIQNNATVVPSQAVQPGQQGEFVFVVRPDLTAEARPVVVSSRVGEETVVRQGVRPGELVVTSGQLRLAPGVKVQIQNGREGERPREPQLTSLP